MPYVTYAKFLAVKVWVTPPTVRVPTAVTRFWLRVPAVKAAVVWPVNVIVISWFWSMLGADALPT